MEGYDWDISKSALERFLAMGLEDRDALLRHFDKLAFSEGATIPDGSFEIEGKPYHTMAIGRYVITFVYDHPIQVLHILAIE